jgi:hypothetical protein
MCSRGTAKRSVLWPLFSLISWVWQFLCRCEIPTIICGWIKEKTLKNTYNHIKIIEITFENCYKNFALLFFENIYIHEVDNIFDVYVFKFINFSSADNASSQSSWRCLRKKECESWTRGRWLFEGFFWLYRKVVSKTFYKQGYVKPKLLYSVDQISLMRK